MIQFLFVFSDWALFVLRIVLGIILLTHGLLKIKNLKENHVSFKKIAFKFGLLWKIKIAFLETVFGFFILFGFLTQIIAFLVFIDFLITLITIKKDTKNIKEIELTILILASTFILITMSGGSYSIDHVLKLLIY